MVDLCQRSERDEVRVGRDVELRPRFLSGPIGFSAVKLEDSILKISTERVLYPLAAGESHGLQENTH